MCFLSVYQCESLHPVVTSTARKRCLAFCKARNAVVIARYVVNLHQSAQAARLNGGDLAEPQADHHQAHVLGPSPRRVSDPLTPRPGQNLHPEIGNVGLRPAPVIGHPGMLAERSHLVADGS